MRAGGDHSNPMAALVVVVDDGTELVVGHMGAERPDLACVGALARLQLAARRHRCRVILRNASAELLDLVVFMGLEDVVAPTPRGVEAGRTAGTPARCRGRT